MGQIVPPVELSDAKLALVGEAPGADEVQQGKPFVGSSGRVLDGMLRDADIMRSQVSIYNVMDIRPPDNDFSKFYLDKDRTVPSRDLMRGWETLRRRIRAQQYNVVVALGAEPLYALTGKRGITAWRGSLLWNDSLSVKVIGTFHPASVMRQWLERPVAVFDLMKARKEATAEGYFYQPPIIHYIDDAGYVMEAMETAKRWDRISLDLETVGNVITDFAISNGIDTFQVQLHWGQGSTFHLHEEHLILRGLDDLLRQPMPKIFQNAQFDVMFLRQNYRIAVNGVIDDTMLMQWCVYPELPKGLDFLCSLYTNHPYYSEGKKDNPAAYRRYNAMDARVTADCFDILVDELKEAGSYRFYLQNIRPLIGTLMDVQNVGVVFDQRQAVELRMKLETERKALQDKLDKAVGHELNVMSNKQMQQFLYEDLKLPSQHRRGRKAPTTDDDAITVLGAKFPNPLFDVIKRIRQIRKLVSTYIDCTIDEDGRMRTSYKIGGTVTGRLSSSKTYRGTGANLQNLEKDVIRTLYVADGGHVFLEFDLKQAEVMVVAYLSKCAGLLAAFNSGQDVHAHTASQIYKVPIELVTPKQRYDAKRCVHASNYGMGPMKFALVAGVTAAEAKDTLNRYLSTFFEIENWHREVQDELRRNKMTLRTPMGSHRQFFGRWGDDLFRDAYAFVPQGTVGLLLNQGLVNAHLALRPDCHVAMQVHDSMVVLVPDRQDAIDDTIKTVKNALNIALNLPAGTLTIPVEVKLGKNLGDLVEVK